MHYLILVTELITFWNVKYVCLKKKKKMHSFIKNIITSTLYYAINSFRLTIDCITHYTKLRRCTSISLFRPKVFFFFLVIIQLYLFMFDSMA